MWLMAICAAQSVLTSDIVPRASLHPQNLKSLADEDSGKISELNLCNALDCVYSKFELNLFCLGLITNSDDMVTAEQFGFGYRRPLRRVFRRFG